MASTAAPAAERGTDAERHALRAWVDAALFREAQPATLPAPTGLEVIRQDFGRFRLHRSVMDTPLQIGARKYEHGLGTHSVSQVVVRLPTPGARFEAQVGIDNNYDTGGKRGTAVFVVEVAGKEALRSGVCRGGEAPVPVRVDLKGATEFVLRVLDAGDGPGWDQSDWAEAFVMTQSGEKIWLDEMAVVARNMGFWRSTAEPFSFVYGGKDSAQLLPGWKRTHTRQPAQDGRERHVVTYADPATGLEVVCEAAVFAGSPAIEWVLRFRNSGQADTPILQKVLPLDLRRRGSDKESVVLHHAHGSTCAPTDFLPMDRAIAPKGEIKLAPAGGRSSNGVLPFFNLAWDDGGVAGAIGWSGQWAMRVARSEGGELSLQAGQQTTHLKLHPGESIRTPRILLVMWDGTDRFGGHNLLRRVLLAHYVPRLDGEIAMPPVTQNTWFVFNSGNDVTEANQLEAIAAMAPLGVEAYWLDAGWFEGGWPSGVGSWVPKASAFPRGLKPLGDAAHKAGMKFVVWFEPERVNPASRIAKEHPQFVLRAGGGDGLFNLGDTAARDWLTDHLSGCIRDWGIDIYRNDFNIDPLAFWQAADKPDRQGITEIRYVEGLYAMWDELRRRKPGLAIDNCASGGRRIDLEMISRSFPLWRSDTQCCGRAMPVQDQVQTAGLSLYVPLHSAGCWGFDPYTFRSVATTGLNVCPDVRPPGFPHAQALLAQAAIAEAKALRPLYLGDFYPLTDVNVDDRHWCAWQFDCPQAPPGQVGRGFAMFFRRPGSPYVAMEAGLHGLDAAATYEVSLAEGYQAKPAVKMSGADLARLRVQIASAPGSMLVTYRKAVKP